MSTLCTPAAATSRAGLAKPYPATSVKSFPPSPALVREPADDDTRPGLPFAVRDRSMIPLLGGLDRLPSPRRTAPPTTFGMAGTSETSDRFEHVSCRATGRPI